MLHQQPLMTVLDPQTFNASTLADSEGRAVAWNILESHLAGSDTPLDLIVQDLCSVPNLFEFVITDFPSAKGLVYRILDTYPADPALVETFTNILLRRLASVMFALPPYLFSTEILRRIGRYSVHVEDALPVLSLLCSPTFLTRIATTNALGDPGYKEREKSKRKNKDDPLAIDATLFDKLGAKIPSDDAEASQMARRISDDLKTILKFYLELLLESSSLAQYFEDANTSTGHVTVAHVAQEDAKVIEVAQPKPSAYPIVQPMKAALYFENADGFGDWRIIISTDAANTLSKLAKCDKEKCVSVLKKIKQLSKGNFSSENQRKLNSTFGVPIFEARTPQDLQLVYQVDVIPDPSGEVEQQAIKIYGIYTDSKMNCIWDAMGQRLAGKGDQYYQRCTSRTRLTGQGGYVYSPTCFPLREIQNDTKPDLLVLSENDMTELHSLLVLEKFVAFSQAFLHSLIANQDVQHVFELSTLEHKIVECNTSCYVLGRSGTGKTTTMLFKMLRIQRLWEIQMSDMPKPRQIFVTKSHVLAKKVEKYFKKLHESLALARYSREDLKKLRMESMERRFVNPEDEKQLDIPQQYSALEEKHFPLFVTFDKLASMIAADLLTGDNPEAKRLATFFIDTDDVKAQDFSVTYDVFARTYWPHFPLTKGLDPWLVFAEFMGVIKGSEKSLSYPYGFLDEEAYYSLSARTNPTFANQRQTLYAIFKAYCRLKRERRHHDVADRTHAILKTLLGGTPLQGQKVDHLYVDEAQDNLLIDALLLRVLCRNLEGLFWAGDTAQAISAGSSFRFEDLTAFLYRLEHGQSTHLIQDRSTIDPTPFQLTTNYRSHGGIVKCAHAIIELITHFWPDAIDRLQPECAVVDGLKPTFFYGWDEDSFIYQQFLSGEPGCPTELGANQCTLVRDHKAVEKLKSKQFGGTIMTLYDSKGLEFNDVLLYNFFEDSAVDVSRWRVLLNHLEGAMDSEDLAKMRAPSFERDGRFAGVCSELKLLYVGITRARRSLWIFDNSEKSEPMRMIWRNQVQICKPGMKLPRIAVSSTPEEWAAIGYELFNHKKYAHAMDCFARASQPRVEAICRAFHLRELARATVGVASLKVQRDAFLVAADAFVASGKDAPSGRDQLQYYRNAADCYVRAGNDNKAAVAHINGQEYDLAARRYRKAGLFDKTLEILQQYSGKIPSKTSEELYTVCRLFYCSKHDIDRPRVQLFPSFEAEIEFLESYELDSARAELYENRGEYLKAAQLHLSENRPFDAIRDFLKEKGSHDDAIQQATRVILDTLWRCCSFGIMAEEVAACSDVVQLLDFADQLPADCLDPFDHHEISMFHAIAQADLDKLEQLSQVFVGERNAAALLALDHLFSHFPNLRSYTLEDMSLFLENFRKYACLLHDIISHPNPLSVKSIMRLFCITEISNTQYSVEAGSFLHNSAAGNRKGSTYSKPSIVNLCKGELVTSLQKALAAHLCERVNEENRLCCNAVVFSQCLTFIVHGKCNRADCPQEHVRSADLDARRYNIRIGIHLQQIRVLQLMYSVNQHPDRQSSVIYWLTHLYEAFNPQSHVQGSAPYLDLSMIPGARESLGVMKHWVRDALYALRADWNRSAFLTNVLKLTSLIFTFDPASALQCIRQAHFNAAHVKEFVYPDGRYVLEDIVSLFDGTQPTCISAGLSFLGHVIKTTLYVDLSVFCDCLEEVIGKMAISWRLSYKPPLDELVLPRGWLSSNKDFTSKKNIRITLILDLLSHVRDLLLLLQTDPNAARRIYSLSHTKLTPMLCTVFISRICRALCLLTYNVHNSEIRSKVQYIFDSLRNHGPTYKLYRKYVLARRIDYLKVMVDYDDEAGVVMEDLVQLLHKQRDSRRVSQLRLRRIQPIYFSSPSEIPSLLASHLVAACSDLHAEAPAFIPEVGRLTQIEAVTGEETSSQPGSEETNIELIDDEVQEETQEHQPTLNEPVLSRKHEPTEDEISAATQIQATYRAYCKHRAAQARAIGKGLQAQRNTVFIICLKNICAFNWGRTLYRTLYLWALPCLVVSLDNAISVAHEFKKKTKSLLAKGDHEHLEELGKRMTMISILLKDGHSLRKQIEPNAIMHQAKNKDAMKNAVLDVEEFLHRLPSATMGPQIQQEFKVAYKLVMVDSSQREKPTLNTEDL